MGEFMRIKVLCRVKDNLDETIGYDIVDLESGKKYKCVEIEKLDTNKIQLEEASIVSGKMGKFIRCKKAIPERVEKARIIALYHGSNCIVKKPDLSKGYERNDYGQGFYTTRDKEKANEWALNTKGKSYRNEYRLNLHGLKVCQLDKYGSLAWIAEVLANRGIGDSDDGVKQELADGLVAKYRIDASNYDIIIGYRADDSYFRIIKDFMDNILTVFEVERYFHKGDLGTQIFLKSR